MFQYGKPDKNFFASFFDISGDKFWKLLTHISIVLLLSGKCLQKRLSKSLTGFCLQIVCKFEKSLIYEEG
jgi:hypothetical protein